MYSYRSDYTQSFNNQIRINTYVCVCICMNMGIHIHIYSRKNWLMIMHQKFKAINMYLCNQLRFRFEDHDCEHTCRNPILVWRSWIRTKWIGIIQWSDEVRVHPNFVFGEVMRLPSWSFSCQNHNHLNFHDDTMCESFCEIFLPAKNPDNRNYVMTLVKIVSALECVDFK